MRFALTLCVLACFCASIVALPLSHCAAAELAGPEGVSTREVRLQAARGVPLQKLNPNISQEVRPVLENPSYFRRMPSQQIACDPEMFTLLVRRPEVMVNIWEVMGITKVTAKRVNPVSFLADDGVGTACKCDLVYSDNNLHIYLGYGSYEGTMAPRKVTGRCVCLLRTEDHNSPAGEPNITGTMDVFLKVDNFGADLLTRSIGPFVGKTADYNFVETSKFISQISQVCQTNPSAAQALAMRLDHIDDATRREFAEIVTRIASNSADQYVAETLLGRYERSAVTAESQVEQRERSSIAPEPPPSRREPTVVMAEAPLGLAVESHVTPAAIAPRKANIFMRR
ncbi:MAG: hypothetical protein ABI557_04375 [Aureliella sp.]